MGSRPTREKLMFFHNLSRLIIYVRKGKTQIKFGGQFLKFVPFSTESQERHSAWGHLPLLHLVKPWGTSAMIPHA